MVSTFQPQIEDFSKLIACPNPNFLLPVCRKTKFIIELNFTIQQEERKLRTTRWITYNAETDFDLNQLPYPEIEPAFNHIEKEKFYVINKLLKDTILDYNEKYVSIGDWNEFLVKNKRTEKNDKGFYLVLFKELAEVIQQVISKLLSLAPSTVRIEAVSLIYDSPSKNLYYLLNNLEVKEDKPEIKIPLLPLKDLLGLLTPKSYIAEKGTCLLATIDAQKKQRISLPIGVYKSEQDAKKTLANITKLKETLLTRFKELRAYDVIVNTKEPSPKAEGLLGLDLFPASLTLKPAIIFENDSYTIDVCKFEKLLPFKTHTRSSKKSVKPNQEIETGYNNQEDDF